MSDKDAAMQQALELIERLNQHGWILADFEDEVYASIASLKAALEQPPLPVQEPVACRFCHSKKGCWTWQCYHCGEIDDVQQPAPLPVQPEQDFKTATKEDAALKQVIDLIQPVAALANGTPFEHSEVIQRCVDAVEIALEALAQPVQEPVAYDKTEMNSFVIDLYDKKMQEGKHGHYEIMFHVVHQAIKRVTLPLPVQPEPLEYWNAVEGWVKIDEVREHFDAVNCGTIYKHGGEGRVPLYTAPPQRQWVGLTEFQFAEIYNKWNDSNGSTPWGLYHAIEKALKAKNHG